MEALESLVRVAVLTKLKSDGGLLALVSASSIDPDPEHEPTWPFVKVEAFRCQPFEATCVRGGLVTGDIHGFAGPKKSGDQITAFARDHAGQIGAALQRALHRTRLEIEGGGNARIRLSDIRLLDDGSPQAFHWFAQINARVLAE